jgi:anti-sigma B factor antagonist
VITTEIGANGDAVLVVAGAIDLASRDEIVTAAQTALNDASTKALVLDLSGVTFIDSTGIGAIIGLAGEAEDLGRGFRLRRPSDRVSRILEVTGLADQWTIESS